MSPNVEPEETQAIMDLMGTEPARSGEVAERDFRRPRRLSGQMRADLQTLYRKALPSIEARLANVLGVGCPLELVSVGEASAEHIAGESDMPLVALRFKAGGQPSWIVWENLAAVTAVEKILGSSAKAAERRLSHVECRVAQDLLAPLATIAAEALGFATQELGIVQSLEALGSWREGGAQADVHRLEIELQLEGPGEASALRIYLPAPGLAAVAARNDEAIALPAHLNKVEVSVSAQLAGCEVSLDQLLALEEGDVIPIDANVEDLALISVEGCAFARARLGQRRGRLAIRIEQLEDNPEETR